MLKKAADPLAGGVGRGVRCQRSGREADQGPQGRRIDLSMHASNGPIMCLARALLREYFRHRVGEGDLLLKRAAVPSPGGMGRWARCLLIGPEADSRPGKRRTDQVSWCAIRRRAGCSEGEYYATVSAHATFCSKERLSYRQVVRADGPDAADPVGRPTSGRKFGKLPPESPWQGGLEV